MSRLSIVNAKTAFYQTESSLYVINKLMFGWEISNMKNCMMIGYSDTLTGSIEIINDYENGQAEVIPC